MTKPIQTAAPRTRLNARIRLACRAFILAGLAASVVGFGAAGASAATLTPAAHSSAISFLPPDPCAPVIVPPTPI